MSEKYALFKDGEQDEKSTGVTAVFCWFVFLLPRLWAGLCITLLYTLFPRITHDALIERAGRMSAAGYSIRKVDTPND